MKNPLLYGRRDLRMCGIKISDSTIARLEATGKFPKGGVRTRCFIGLRLKVNS